MKLIIATIILFCTNLVCILLMHHDKKQAKKVGRRIPERTLFISAACFGAIGGTLAMHLFRHKTQHWYFKVFFPLMMLAQIIIIAFVCWKWLI